MPKSLNLLVAQVKKLFHCYLVASICWEFSSFERSHLQRSFVFVHKDKKGAFPFLKETDDPPKVPFRP